MTDEIQILPCPKHRWRETLTLMFSHLPEQQVAAQVNLALETNARQELSLDGLFIADIAGKLAAAGLAVEAGGRTAVIWCPKLVPGVSAAHRSLVMQRLIEQIVNWTTSRHARLVHVVIGPDELAMEPTCAESFRGLGFIKLGDLSYLHLPLHHVEQSTDEPVQLESPSKAANSRDADLRIVPYQASLQQTLGEILAQSYLDSLDTPLLNGARTTDEVIEGHRGQAFDPTIWFLAYLADPLITRSSNEPEQSDLPPPQSEQWVGCILASPLTSMNAMELSYLGIARHQRGKGFGRQLVKHLIATARKRDSSMITLAVDASNHPALSLYQNLGFMPYDERTCYTLFADPADGISRTAK